MVTTTLLLKVAVEVSLGFGIKLFIENGRIHPADFVNDYLFWLPGVDAKDGCGLERQVADLLGPVEHAEHAASETQRATG